MESSGGKCFLMFCFVLMGRLLDKSVGLVSDSSAMSGGHTIMCPIPGWTARGALNQPEKPWPSAADVEFTSKACIHSILSLRSSDVSLSRNFVTASVRLAQETQVQMLVAGRAGL